MNFKRFALAALSVLLLATGCYKEEIDALKEQVKDLEMNTLEEQVKNMNATVADLRALQEQVAPAVDSLMAAKSQLQSSIDKMEAQIAGTDSASVEMQATLVGLRSQMQAVDDAIKALQSANLGQRIDDLNGIVDAASKNFKESIDKLTGMAETFATLDELSKLQAAVDAMSAAFGDNFKNALEASKEKIISWVSESQVMKDLFDKYYTKDIVDQRLKAIEDKDIAQENDLKELRAMIQQQDTDLREVIAQAVKDAKARLAERIDEINRNAERIDGNYDALELRVKALEELPAVIGDYSDYKGTLIADILALQKIIGDPETDGTLVSLVNTLKLVLTQSEGTYFNLGQIVADILTNTGDIADHDSRIAALDSLCGTLATIEALNSLDAEVRNLAVDIVTNQGNITTLVQRVDAIVAQWTDQVYAQIDTNAAHIERLKEEDLKLWLAIEANKEDQKNADTVLTHLIADINVNIAALMIPQLRDSLDAINNLLNNCRVGNITGLQANLDSLDARIKAIWDVIGSETLDIKGSIINAINVINRRFGGELDGTLSEILAALNADLNIIRGDGWAADSLSIVDLKAITDQLNTIVNGKADTLRVQSIEANVSQIQQTILGIITESNADEKLAAWLKRAEADTVYATIADYNTFLQTYKGIVGEGPNPAEGTVLYQLKVLNMIAGNGEIGNWASDLTDAVNKLHALVGDDTVSTQATKIAQGLIQDLINAILGGEGTANDIADSLKSFHNNIDTLYAHIGEMNKISATYPDIATAIQAMDEILGGLNARYDTTYAKRTHTHVVAEITDFQTEVNALIEAITGKISDLQFGAKTTLVNAINELYIKFGQYHTSGKVDTLLEDLQLALTAAFMHGDTVLMTQFGLNLDTLKADINDIIKEGGVIDSRIDTAIEHLNIGQYLSSQDLLDSNYIKHSQLDTHVVFALAALNVDIWNSHYTYDQLDKAINEVYDSLKTYIYNYDQAMIAFGELESRIKAIEDLIGPGAFSQTRTIQHVTDSLAALFGSLGSGETVSGLINNLRQTDTAIVRALLGSDYSDGLGIGAEYSLKALKDRLDTLGIGDILSAGPGSMTLAGVLDTIRTSVSNLYAAIGNGFRADSTIAQTLSRLSEQLGTFTNTEFESQFQNLRDSLNTLIDTLSQNGAGNGSLQTVGELVSRLNSIYNCWTSLEVKGETDLNTILNSLSSRMDRIIDIIGDTSSTTFKDITDLYNKYVALQREIQSGNWLGNILNNSEGVQKFLGVEDIKKVIGDITQLNENLVTPEDSTLVHAINELKKEVDNLSGKAEGTYATTAALNTLLAQVIGGNDIEYKNLATLASEMSSIMSYIKDWPDTSKKTIYQSIEEFSNALSVIGTRGEQFGDKGIWDVIAELNALITAPKDLNYLLNSFVYIPETSDGDYILYCNQNRTSFSKMVLKFSVASAPGFATNFKAGKYTVSGLVNNVKTRALQSMAVENATMSADSTTMTVEFSAATMLDKMPKTGNAQVAVVISEGSSGESFTSRYISVKIEDSSKSIEVDPAPTTFTFRSGVSETFKITVSDVLGKGYTVTQTGDWFEAPDSDGVIEISKKDEAAHSNGKLEIKAKDGSETYTYIVEQAVYKFGIDASSLPADLTIAENTSNLSTVYGYEHEYKDIQLTCTSPVYVGEYLVETSGDFIQSASVTAATADNAGKLKFKLAANNDEIKNGTITIKTKDGSGAQLVVGICQNKLAYTMSLGDAPEGLTKDGNKLTAANGANKIYSIPFSCTPEWNGKFTVTRGDQTMVTDARIQNGNLVFTLSSAGTDRTSAITIKPEGYSGEALTVTVAQPKVVYTLALGDLPQNSGLTKSGNTLTAEYGFGKSYDKGIPVTCTPECNDFDVVCSDPAMVTSASVTSGKLYFTLSDAAAARTSTITIYPKGITTYSLVVTVAQPKVSYSISLGDMSSYAGGLTKDGSKLTAASGAAKTYESIPLVITPAYTSDIWDIKIDSTIVTSASVGSGHLAFTLSAGTSAERSATITIAPKGMLETESKLTVTVVQPALQYTLGIGNALPDSLSKTGDTVLKTKYGLGQTYSGIQITCEPACSNFTVAEDCNWISNANVSNGYLTFTVDPALIEDAQRSSTMTVTPAGSDQSLTITLVQPKLTYDLSIGTLPADCGLTLADGGNTLQCNNGNARTYTGIPIVSANPVYKGTYTVEVPAEAQSWLTDASVTDGILTFSTTTNKTAARGARITIKTTDGSDSELTVLVNQPKLVYALSLDKKSIPATLTYAAGSLTTASGAQNTYKVRIICDPECEDGFTVDMDTDATSMMVGTPSVDANDTLTFTIGQSAVARRQGKITVKPVGSDSKLELTIIQTMLSYKLKLGTTMPDGLEFVSGDWGSAEIKATYGNGTTYEGLQIISDPAYRGNYDVEFDNTVVTGVSVDALGSMDITLSDNFDGEDPREAEFKVYPEGNAASSLTVKVKQPRLHYTFSVDAAESGFTPANTVQTANATLTTQYVGEKEFSGIKFNCTPACASFVFDGTSANITSPALVQSNTNPEEYELKFTLAQTSADKTSTLVIKPNNATTESFSISIVQDKVDYGLLWGSFPTTYFTRDNATVTTTYFKAFEETIPVSLNPECEYKLSYTNASGLFASAPEKATGGIKLSVAKNEAVTAKTETVSLIPNDGSEVPLTFTVKQQKATCSFTLASWDGEDGNKLKRTGNTAMEAYWANQKEYSVKLSCNYNGATGCKYNYVCTCDESIVTKANYDGENLTFTLSKNNSNPNAARVGKIYVGPDDGSGQMTEISITQSKRKVFASDAPYNEDGTMLVYKYAGVYSSKSYSLDNNFNATNYSVTYNSKNYSVFRNQSSTYSPKYSDKKLKFTIAGSYTTGTSDDVGLNAGSDDMATTTTIKIQVTK
ncbi:MAG: hypothetical protein MJY41_00710 [Bacteroidales bacterium]|nr:hypothetical protein [Bacteroidales bacterium]